MMGVAFNRAVKAIQKEMVDSLKMRNEEVKDYYSLGEYIEWVYDDDRKQFKEDIQCLLLQEMKEKNITAEFDIIEEDGTRHSYRQVLHAVKKENGWQNTIVKRNA